jgi:formylglycine-generating enzyme required for sulfatase activity
LKTTAPTRQPLDGRPAGPRLTGPLGLAALLGSGFGCGSDSPAPAETSGEAETSKPGSDVVSETEEPFRLCERDSDCAGAPSGSRCDRGSRRCVPCLSSSDCEGEGEGLRCVNKACVAPTPCSVSDQCSGQECLAELGVCADCEVDDDCEPSEVCHARRCAPRCSGLVCRAQGLVCSDSSPACVECNTHADCSSNPDRTRCDVSTHACVCLARFTGSDCTTCAAGWGGPTCNICEAGWFGPGCGARSPTEGFVSIPPGTFTMGSPEDEPFRGRDELLHDVTLTRAFWLQATEVTQRQWEAVMGSNPSHFADCGHECPVENVSWEEVVRYLNRLSDMEGLPRCYEGVSFRGLDCPGYRLPTEAEWEYAARSELSEDDLLAIDTVAWYRSNADGRTNPVRQLEPNTWGLHDMLGNVWEWVHDWYGEYADGESDPIGPSVGTHRVGRGGSWIVDARGVRPARRSRYEPTYRYATLGFRAARSQLDPGDAPEPDPEAPGE